MVDEKEREGIDEDVVDFEVTGTALDVMDDLLIVVGTEVADTEELVIDDMLHILGKTQKRLLIQTLRIT